MFKKMNFIESLKVIFASSLFLISLELFSKDYGFFNTVLKNIFILLSSANFILMINKLFICKEEK